MSAMKFKICLLGDMVRHVILKPNPETETEKNSPKNTDYKAYIEITGAPILRKMICNVLE